MTAIFGGVILLAVILAVYCSVTHKYVTAYFRERKADRRRKRR
jgi:hypothetical protein